jgi:hypothetical protein
MELAHFNMNGAIRRKAEARNRADEPGPETPRPEALAFEAGLALAIPLAVAVVVELLLGPMPLGI